MWKSDSKFEPTHAFIYDKIRDVIFVSQYVMHDDTRKKAQRRMKALLRTLYV